MILIYFLFGIISAFSFGISNAYWKTAAKDIDYPYLVVYRGLFASVIFGLLWILLWALEFQTFGLYQKSASALDYVHTALISLVCSLGLFFFLSSLKYQPVSITIPLTSINIFNILTTVFIIGETFHFIYLVAFSLALIGILLTQNYSFNRKLEWNRGASYAILASFFWGVTYPLFKLVSPKIGAIPLSFILESCVTFSAVIWAFNSHANMHIKQSLQPKLIKHYVILSVLLIGGTLFFNLAIQGLSVLTLNLLSNFQLITTIAIGFVFYKERITINQTLGIVLIFLSIVLSQYLL